MQTNATPDDLRQWIMSFYVQDTFHISSRFTLNCGSALGAEVLRPRTSTAAAVPSACPRSLPASSARCIRMLRPECSSTATPAFRARCGTGTRPTSRRASGMVWNPHGKGSDTLRIGGAILYEDNETWFNERETTNAPIGTAIDIPNPVGGFSNPCQGYPGGSPFPDQWPGLVSDRGRIRQFPAQPEADLCSAVERHLSAADRRQLDGFGKLPGQQDHASLEQQRRNQSRGVPGPGPMHDQRESPTPHAPRRSTRTSAASCSWRIPTLGAAYASINTVDDGAVAHYNGMLLSLQHRFAHNFTFLTNYTNSYCISDTDFGAALATPGNSQRFNRHADWGPCVFDTRHNFNTSLVATSSLKTTKPWVNRLLSDWQIAPLVHVSSGQPLNVTVGKDNSLSGLSNGNDRPNQVAGERLRDQPGLQQWHHARVSNGSIPRRSAPARLARTAILDTMPLRGPDTVNFDAAISRISGSRSVTACRHAWTRSMSSITRTSWERFRRRAP